MRGLGMKGWAFGFVAAVVLPGVYVCECVYVCVCAVENAMRKNVLQLVNIYMVYIFVNAGLKINAKCVEERGMYDDDCCARVR